MEDRSKHDMMLNVINDIERNTEREANDEQFTLSLYIPISSIGLTTRRFGPPYVCIRLLPYR